MQTTNDLNKIKKALLNDEPIIYPTEGVYGIGCLPNSEKAINKIILIKKRAENKGFILIASSFDQLRNYIDKAYLTNKIEQLIIETVDEFITYILPKSEACPNYITGGKETIAIRLTNHNVVVEICDFMNSALISTSVNLSGKPTITDKNLIIEKFKNSVPIITNGKLGNKGKPSSIIDLTKKEPVLIRN